MKEVECSSLSYTQRMKDRAILNVAMTVVHRINQQPHVMLLGYVITYSSKSDRSKLCGEARLEYLRAYIRVNL